MATINLLPNAEGTTQQWSPFPATPGHFDKVDDPVALPDGDSTYVYTGVINQIEEFNHQDFVIVGTLSSIDNVRLIVGARVTALPDMPGDDHRFNLGVNVGGIRYGAVVDSILGIFYANFFYDWALNPADGQAWEKADIDNLQSSIKSTYFGAYSGPPPLEQRATQVYFTVTYTLAPTVTPVAGKGLLCWTP